MDSAYGARYQDLFERHWWWRARERVIMEALRAHRPTRGWRNVLDVGCATGYSSALLARLARSVIALEEDRALAALAEPTLAELTPGVAVVIGPLAAGWLQGKPYDIILIEGAVQTIPAALEGQLRADTGRLVTVRAAIGSMGSAVLAEPTPLGLRAKPMFDCATPPLPSLLPKPSFTF